MTLKAVLFDFNGVIINDEPLHERLIEQLLLEENLRPKPGEFRERCLGRSDRACLQDVFLDRGRVLTDADLDCLIARKAKAYGEALSQLESLPIYPDVADVLVQLQDMGCPAAIVSGALREEIEVVLERSQLREYFSVIVSADHITLSKPEPEGYLSAIGQLNHTFPSLQLQAADCLAIEDTFTGIEAAKRAGIPVVGVANSYPFHMLQRCANWTVDYLSDLEWPRLQAGDEALARAEAVAGAAQMENR